MDEKIFDIIKKEEAKQKEYINLIASENYVSEDILKALGSVLTNKYAEGYSGRRYYSGCEFVDAIEDIAIKRARELFDIDYVNVQPYSGTQANMAVYSSLLSPGDKILSLDLSCGGHISHGSKVSFVGKIYNCIYYSLDKITERIDMNTVREIAKKEKPKLIILDEILANIAEENIVSIMKVLKNEMNSLGVCGIIVTHAHKELVYPYVEQIWHMDNEGDKTFIRQVPK